MTKPYFPNVPRELMDLEGQFRQHVALLDDEHRQALYELWTAHVPGYTPCTWSTEGDLTLVHQLGQTIAFPTPMPMIKYQHVACGYAELIFHKYNLPGFVEVAPGDVVVDCGAFVGGFSLMASEVAGEVHLFEPGQDNFAAMQYNFDGKDHVVLNLRGLYDRTGTITFNVSSSGVEHSILEPDDHDVLRTETIDIVRIDDYAAERQLDRIDFVKVEAEGVEVEVVHGIGELRPAKIAVDVSPERDNESPHDEIAAYLEERGYETQRRFNVLFARLPGAAPTAAPDAPARRSRFGRRKG